MRSRVQHEPFLSVIVPVRDDPNGLYRCLQALAQQSVCRDAYEVIVVDDDSRTSVSASASVNFADRVLRGARRNSFAARNLGARCARGDYLAFCDADCVPHSRWLEYVI